MPRPTALVLATPTQPLAELVHRAREYAADSRATSTKKAYLSDFASFEGWCARQGVPSAPTTPATVAVYLAALADAGRKASTIERALAGIAWAQRARGHEWFRAHPAIAAVMAGIRRRNGTAPTQKAPVVDQEARGARRDARRQPTRATRSRLAHDGVVRRVPPLQLVALEVADVKKEREGLVVTLRRSKRDQEGRGAEKGIPYASNPALCPVRALAAWLEAARIETGPLFRGVDQLGHVATEGLSDRSVARIVQRAAEAAGLDPATVAGHSLRAGFATTAAKKGKSLDAIMRQTLHKSEQVARGYIRHAKLFDDNAAVGLA